MGYEILIRFHADRPVSQEVLSARLAALAAAGIPEPKGPAPAPDAPAATPPEAAAPAPASTEPPATPAAAPSAPAGAGPWVAANLKGRVDLRLSHVDGNLRGADFDVPFGGTEDEFRRAFAAAHELAEQLGATLFDPQLGHEVGKAGVEEAVSRWRQSQDWMVGVAGTFDVSRSTQELTTAPPLITRRNKIVLGLVGFFIFILWLLDRLSTAMLQPAP